MRAQHLTLFQHIQCTGKNYTRERYLKFHCQCHDLKIKVDSELEDLQSFGWRYSISFPTTIVGMFIFSRPYSVQFLTPQRSVVRERAIYRF